MSVYSVKGKGWRYDFTLKGTRHTRGWFKRKRDAVKAETERREELLHPPAPTPAEQIPTDMGFLELVNRRLDYVQAYNSESHYREYRYLAKRWLSEWRNCTCDEITQEMIEGFLLSRKRAVSAFTANKELRYLRATFNHGVKKRMIQGNPTDGIESFPVEKRIKFIPSDADINKVIAAADPDTADYLWVIRETMARVGEINKLVWDDVNFKTKHVTVYTRKKKSGDLTPRHIPMTRKLYKVLSKRFDSRDSAKPWVFWHSYWDVKSCRRKVGPFKDRHGIMRSLCKKAGVQYFRFHALRHAGASTLELNNISIGTIQRILGHESRTTTEIYLHSIGHPDRQAMAIFETARQKSHMKSHTNKEGVTR
jgi:integrase